MGVRRVLPDGVQRLVVLLGIFHGFLQQAGLEVQVLQALQNLLRRYRGSHFTYRGRLGGRSRRLTGVARRQSGTYFLQVAAGGGVFHVVRQFANVLQGQLAVLQAGQEFVGDEWRPEGMQQPVLFRLLNALGDFHLALAVE